MFLYYDVMNHRFITKIDELMNSFINRRKIAKNAKVHQVHHFFKTFISSSKIQCCDFVQKIFITSIRESKNGYELQRE